jgi:hypothetical protein
MLLGQRTALFHYMLHQFGFIGFDDLRQQFRSMELEATASDNSVYYYPLSVRVKFPVDRLKQYDENLLDHLRAINSSRSVLLNLKYYQYFSLVFTEYYLDRYFEDRHALLGSINDFIANSHLDGLKSISPYLEGDLNKVAYWNATGSGKTFITHVNILQYRHYAQLHDGRYRNLIFLTPSQDMSRQHLGDLQKSAIVCNYYWEDRSSQSVKVIDIHKIREYASGSGVTIPLAEFERDNAIFVDEGHKGDSKEDSQWRTVRETLSHDGFAFEYSATFGQLNDERLQEEYAKCIIFDYSYGHFWEDGYGKDYWIHNLTDDSKLGGSREHRYLLQNLLLFIQQKIYFDRHKVELQEYSIENPLLVFVGSSVEPRASKKRQAENETVISDVKKVLDFFRDLLSSRDKYVGYIDDLRNNRPLALFRGDYWGRLDYLFSLRGNGEAIYDDALKYVFNNATPGELELYTLRNASKEIALKVKNADSYFAVIYIGDTSTFRTPIEAEYEIRRDVTAPSLFQSLSDTQPNPVNILIGARIFIEGWNNYRVSSIGLINFGRSRGSQIIQLFGRGVRLKGKNNSLKRSNGTADAPDHIEVAETLNIFGLRADYMKMFKEDLEREGIKTEKRKFRYRFKLTKDLGQLDLFMLERKEVGNTFESSEVFALTLERSIKVQLDIAPKKFLTIAGDRTVYDQVNTVQFTLATENLDCVDWDDIYLKLLQHKRDRRYFMIHISRKSLRRLFEEIDYQIISDRQIVVSSFLEMQKVQKLTLEICRNYLDLFYRRRLKEFEGRFLVSGILRENHPSLANLEWQVEVSTTDTQGESIVGIQAIIEHLEKLADFTSEYPQKFKDDQFLLNCWIDAHLYQPLIKDEDNQSTLVTPAKSIVESIVPPGMNEGEILFIENLKDFIVGQKHRYQDCEFYLLRNMSRGKGFGLYFSSGGFYPDFLFWIKRSGKQYLTFIDPHGLRNEANGWESDKVNLHKTIKRKQQELSRDDVILNSFILQPPPGFESAGISRWHRDDDPDRSIELSEYACLRNVLEMPTASNGSGPGGYVDFMIGKILL